MATLDIITRLRNEAAAGLTGLKNDFKGLDQAADSSDKKVGKLSKTLKVGLAAGATAAAAGMAVLVTQSAKAVELAGIQEEAERKLAETVRSTGMAAGFTTEELLSMASGLQNVTTFGDETIIRGQQLLLTFTNIGRDVFPRATEASLDMAETFGSVDSAAVQLGKALNDPIKGITALQRVGVSFTESQKEQITVLQQSGDIMGAQTIILDELARQFGGQARAAADTFSGRMQQVENSVGDAYEVLGFALIPALEKLATETAPSVVSAIEALAPAAEGMATGVVDQVTLMSSSVEWSALRSQLIDSGVTWGGLNEIVDDGRSKLDLWRTSADFERDINANERGIRRMEIALRGLNMGLDAGSQEFFDWVRATETAEDRAVAMTEFYSELADTEEDVVEQTEELAEVTDDVTIAQLDAAEAAEEFNDSLDPKTVERLVALFGDEAQALEYLERVMKDADQAGTAYELTAEQIAEVNARAADNTDDFAGSANILATELAQARTELGGFYEQALAGEDITGELNERILEQAIAMGADIEVIKEITDRFTDLTEEEIENKAAAAELRVEQDNLIAKFGEGKLSVEQLDYALELLESGMADTAEEAGYLAQTALPSATGSLGLMSDAAITAKDNILGLTDEALGGLVDGSPYTAEVVIDDSGVEPTIEEIKRGLAGIPDEEVIVTVTYEGDPPPGAGGNQGPPEDGGGNQGFQFGGFTGPGSTTQVAGDVHRREFVFEEPAVRAIGADNLEALRVASRSGGVGGIGGDTYHITYSPTLTVYAGTGGNTADLRRVVRREMDDQQRKFARLVENKQAMRSI